MLTLDPALIPYAQLCDAARAIPATVDGLRTEAREGRFYPGQGELSLTALMDALLALMPESERVHYSAMTGQSLFYLGETSMKHKILAIAEEEGVRQAAYALKVLQSQGELTIASTGKDPATGQLVTQEYRVEGPVMLFLTTTAIDVDEELLNRCLVLTINESREQTAAIQARQRKARTLDGLRMKATADAVLAAHRAAQQLLRPLAVVNPFAEQLTFASDRVRLRRDHAKYLALIDSIALLHQYQRPIRSVVNAGTVIEYVEVIAEDIALANRLAPEHLELAIAEPARLFGRIRHAGAAFLGHHAPEALGDYVAGPNHVLPTSRTARFASGLSVFDFLKRTTWVAADATALAAIGPAAVRLAEAEGLGAHALSVSV